MPIQVDKKDVRNILKINHLFRQKTFKKIQFQFLKKNGFNDFDQN